MVGAFSKRWHVSKPNGHQPRIYSNALELMRLRNKQNSGSKYYKAVKDVLIKAFAFKV